MNYRRPSHDWATFSQSPQFYDPVFSYCTFGLVHMTTTTEKTTTKQPPKPIIRHQPSPLPSIRKPTPKSTQLSFPRLRRLFLSLHTLSLLAVAFVLRIPHHLHTLFLFTYSDIKTIIVPKTAFALIALLSGPTLLLSPHNRPPALQILLTIPPTALWTWLNLLPLAMNNQHKPDDVAEDAENKPWRPIPSGRLTIPQTKRLMFYTYAAAVLLSAYLGGLTEALLLIFEGWVYNSLGAANDSYLARNFLNATGYMTFASGAARVAALQAGVELDESVMLQWYGVLGSVIATTIQFQDLYDQIGDAVRGRKTIPLVLGDGVARLTVAVPVAVWSVLCPLFWGLDNHWAGLPVVLGGWICYRLGRYRSVKADKKSFRVWNVWVIVLYLLPFMKAVA